MLPSLSQRAGTEPVVALPISLFMLKLNFCDGPESLKTILIYDLIRMPIHRLS